MAQEVGKALKLEIQYPLIYNSHVASMITHRNQASNTLVKYLTPIVQYRLQHRYDDGSYQKKPVWCSGRLELGIEDANLQ